MKKRPDKQSFTGIIATTFSDGATRFSMDGIKSLSEMPNLTHVVGAGALERTKMGEVKELRLEKKKGEAILHAVLELWHGFILPEGVNVYAVPYYQVIGAHQEGDSVVVHDEVKVECVVLTTMPSDRHLTPIKPIGEKE